MIVALILVSIVSVTLASVSDLYQRYRLLFDVSEALVVSLFTLEYAINIYVAPDRKAYVFGLWGAIDLLAILPSILLLFDLRALKVTRVLRVMRFLRLLRILRVLKLAKLAARQYDRSREKRLNTLKLDLQIYLIALLSAVVIFSTLEFYAEEFVPNTQFTSIPAAMWWCIVTITTTGYGDMSPATVLGTRGRGRHDVDGPGAVRPADERGRQGDVVVALRGRRPRDTRRGAPARRGGRRRPTPPSHGRRHGRSAAGAAVGRRVRLRHGPAGDVAAVPALRSGDRAG